jgi:hypothetical protein
VAQLDEHGNPVTKSKTVNSVIYTVDSFRPRTAGNFDIIERYSNPDKPADVF